MKKKIFKITVMFALLFNLVLVPNGIAYATHGAECTSTNICTCTGGQTCWYKDPAYTKKSGTICSNGATTVLYQSQQEKTVSGTYGQVNVELRWGSYCVVNWTRGTVYATTTSTKQFGIKATTTTGYYTTYYVQNGTKIPVGTQQYTDMVDGNVTVTAFAGLRSTTCLGDLDSFGHRTGFSTTCNYPTNASYSG